MKVAKYWANETGTARDPKGMVYALVRWGGSNDSLAQARRLARDKLDRTIAKLSAGNMPNRYEYAEGELREELIREITDDNGTLIGAVTRNRYGALVLNTATLLIADVDNRALGFLAGLLALFSSRRARQSRALERIDRFRRDNPQFELRVYETRGGYRVMITNQGFDPTDEATRAIFEQLGSDPLYVKLCRSQACFRARLTPKPWRCGSARVPNLFPRETPEARNAFDTWLRKYEQQARAHGVCNQIGSPGGGLSSAMAELVNLHDRHVLNQGKPLA